MKKNDIFDMTAKLFMKARDGAYDSIRYHDIYKSAKAYAKLKHNGASCTNLVKTDNGWSCVLSDNEKNIILYITRNKDKELSFWEKEL